MNSSFLLSAIVAVVLLRCGEAFRARGGTARTSTSSLKMLVDPVALSAMHDLHSAMSGLALGPIDVHHLYPHIQDMTQRVTTELHQHGMLLSDAAGKCIHT